jgi:hypothetical protein
VPVKLAHVASGAAEAIIGSAGDLAAKLTGFVVGSDLGSGCDGTATMGNLRGGVSAWHCFLGILCWACCCGRSAASRPTALQGNKVARSRRLQSLDWPYQLCCGFRIDMLVAALMTAVRLYADSLLLLV